MSEKVPDDIEVDYKKILEKISEEKEHRHKGLEELRRRKRELDKQGFDTSPSVFSNSRQILSTDRRKVNEYVYEHLLSPRAKEVKISTANCQSRFEEEDLIRKMKNSQSQKNKLKLVDKKARYAALVREIFSPTIDTSKKLEVERRIERDIVKTTNYEGRTGSIDRPKKIFASNSQNILKRTERSGSYDKKIF